MGGAVGDDVGDFVGDMVGAGEMVGALVGLAVGDMEGTSEGESVGDTLGTLEGDTEGRKVGAGDMDGNDDGMAEMVGNAVVTSNSDALPMRSVSAPIHSPIPRATVAAISTMPLTMKSRDGGIVACLPTKEVTLLHAMRTTSQPEEYASSDSLSFVSCE